MKRCSTYFLLLACTLGQFVQAVPPSAPVIGRVWDDATPCWQLTLGRGDIVEFNYDEVGNAADEDGPGKEEETLGDRNSRVAQAISRISASQKTNIARLQDLNLHLQRTSVDTLRGNTMFRTLDEGTLRSWAWLAAKGYEIRTLKFTHVARLGHVIEFTPATVDWENNDILLNFLVGEFDPWLEILDAEDLLEPEVVLAEKVAEAVFEEKTLMKKDGNTVLDADFAIYAFEVTSRNPIILQSYLREQQQSTKNLDLKEADVLPSLFLELQKYFRCRVSLEAGLEYYRWRKASGKPAYSAAYQWISQSSERFETFLLRQYKVNPTLVAFLGNETGYREFTRVPKQ